MKITESNIVSKVEASVLGQCLEFTSNVLKSNISFSLHLKMRNGFNFICFNTDKRNFLLRDSKLKKKPSPSFQNGKVYCKEESSALNAKSGPSTEKES